MIQLVRNQTPQILRNNQQDWTKELIDLVTEYNGYGNIPAIERNPIVNKYNQDEIRNSLSIMSGGKCVFCESIISTIAFTNIEHFYPKSLYPDFTFEYDNLFTSCPKCNISKSDYDTMYNRILNPVGDNPENYISYPELRITATPHSPDVSLAERTIECCGLDRIELSRERSKLLLAFYEVEDNVKEKLEEYNLLSQAAAKLKRLNIIRSAIDNFKLQLTIDNQYAGYLRYIGRNSTIFYTAILEINANADALGLTSQYGLNS